MTMMLRMTMMMTSLMMIMIKIHVKGSRPSGYMQVLEFQLGHLSCRGKAHDDQVGYNAAVHASVFHIPLCLYFCWNAHNKLNTFTHSCRVRNCAFLVANATKNWELATRISQLVASGRPSVKFRAVCQQVSYFLSCRCFWNKNEREFRVNYLHNVASLSVFFLAVSHKIRIAGEKTTTQ